MDNYVVYYFLGKVSEDTQRLSRWPQWEQCFPLFDEILSPYAKTARIKSSQNYVIPVRPRGNVTFKNVPKLAALRWTYENNFVIEAFLGKISILSQEPVSGMQGI